MYETGPVVPWKDLALGAVVVFRQTQEGKGTRGSGLVIDEHGERRRAASTAGAPSRLAAPLPIPSEHPGVSAATHAFLRDSDAGAFSSSEEMKLAVRACPGKGGLV